MRVLSRVFLMAFVLVGLGASASASNIEEEKTPGHQGASPFPGKEMMASKALATTEIVDEDTVFATAFVPACVVTRVIIEGFLNPTFCLIPLLGQEVGPLTLGAVQSILIPCTAITLLGVLLYEENIRHSKMPLHPHRNFDRAMALAEVLVNINRFVALVAWDGTPNLWCVQYFLLTAASLVMVLNHLKAFSSAEGGV